MGAIDRPVRTEQDERVRPPGEKARKVCLPQVQRQLPRIIPIEREYIEDVELHLVIVLTAVKTIEVDPVHYDAVVANGYLAFGSFESGRRTQAP